MAFDRRIVSAPTTNITAYSDAIKDHVSVLFTSFNSTISGFSLSPKLNVNADTLGTDAIQAEISKSMQSARIQGRGVFQINKRLNQNDIYFFQCGQVERPLFRKTHWWTLNAHTIVITGPPYLNFWKVSLDPSYATRLPELQSILSDICSSMTFTRPVLLRKSSDSSIDKMSSPPTSPLLSDHSHTATSASTPPYLDENPYLSAPHSDIESEFVTPKKPSVSSITQGGALASAIGSPDPATTPRRRIRVKKDSPSKALDALLDNFHEEIDLASTDSELDDYEVLDLLMDLPSERYCPRRVTLASAVSDAADRVAHIPNKAAKMASDRLNTLLGLTSDVTSIDRSSPIAWHDIDDDDLEGVYDNDEQDHSSYDSSNNKSQITGLMTSLTYGGSYLYGMVSYVTKPWTTRSR
ncbi:hypothetical protein CANCADRAFT_30093 [Tortispora caseinolytica NRRL Y-17796]|uniref:Inheritance of peroxisomes protein 1 n=1 Tax=Tortispora caseinolytica NRRL Y-17796 TaxID=767744 RepID=A0A1E4TJ61_9ASCO|nr:hypothetical protein CANCADRAFT_30093 [Tortispora caseinolytica NRRL Y-17796]